MPQHAASQPLHSSAVDEDICSDLRVPTLDGSEAGESMEVADYSALFARINLALVEDDQPHSSTICSEQQQRRQSVDDHGAVEVPAPSTCVLSPRVTAAVFGGQPASKRARSSSQPLFELERHSLHQQQHQRSGTQLAADQSHNTSLLTHQQHLHSYEKCDEGSSEASTVWSRAAYRSEAADEEMDELRQCGLLS